MTLGQQVLSPPAPKRIPVSSRVISGVFALLDSLAILLAGFILYVFLASHSTEAIPIYAAAVGFVWISSMLLFQFAGLYEFSSIINPARFADKLVIAFVTSFLFLLAAAFSIKASDALSRLWIGSFALGSCFATFAVRLCAAQIVLRLSNLGIFTRCVVVAGSGEQSARLLARIHDHRPNFVSLLGVFADHSCKRDTFCGYRVLGTLEDVASFTRQHQVDDVIVALPWAAEEEMLGVFHQLRQLPVNVYLSSDLVGFRLDLREPPSHFGNMPILEVMGRPLSDWSVLLKAIEDYALAPLLLVIASPLMALIAIAVKLDSPGPILFKQKRLGFNNQTFEIYKFRTMRHMPTAEQRTIQATPRDPRVTTTGRFLRGWSLDELPQLLNVLNGTMSLVGPRPHAVDHNEEYARQIRGYFARHRVKPGITGWAQVNGLRGETDTPEKMDARVRYDVYYAENWSLLFDIRILMRTVFVLLSGRNAY